MASKKPKANNPGPSPPAGHPMRVELVPIETVHPDPSNVRRHPARNLDAIRASLARFGQQKPIVVDPKGVIRAGNGTYEAAKILGWPDIRVVRTDLAGSEATAYSIADNRSADLAEWDDTALAETLRALQADHVDLSAVGYEDAEVDALLEKIATEHAGPLEPAEDSGPRIDHAAELQEKWKTACGQLWTIASNSTPGKVHRLLCGDSTKTEDVARLMGCETPFLMVTDPPYGVSYDPTWRDEAAKKGLIGFSPSRLGTVENDDRVDWTEAWNLFPGGVAYCWHAGRHASVVQASLESAGFEIRCQIIWVKDSFSISRGHYNWQHEPCWYAVKKGSTAKWIGDHSESTIWRISKVSGPKEGQDVETSHGTQKPLECMAHPIRNHQGDVYDPFLGSGTTAVAAEQNGRIAYGMEISPEYCAVVLDRLSGMGLTPELLA